MKKKLLLITMTIAWLLVGCEDSDSRLSVNQPQLTFAAGELQPREIAVDAVSEWSVKVSETASDWLFAEKINGSTLKISVAKNNLDGVRKGRVILRLNDTSSDIVEILVTQESVLGYKITVTPPKLFFDGKNTPMQEVTVETKGERLTWTADATDDVKEWVDFVVKGDKIEVSVENNNTQSIRRGYIVITPSESLLSKVEIQIIQEPIAQITYKYPENYENNTLVCPYYLSDNVIGVKAVGTKWSAVLSTINGAVPKWLYLLIHDTLGLTVKTFDNNGPIDRECTVTIICAADETQNLSFKVLQKGKK